MKTVRLSKPVALAAAALSLALTAAPARANLPGSTDQVRALVVARTVMFQASHEAPMAGLIGTTDEARRLAAVVGMDWSGMREAILRGAPASTDDARAVAATQR